jgi:hypothetical protein
VGDGLGDHRLGRDAQGRMSWWDCMVGGDGEDERSCCCDGLRWRGCRLSFPGGGIETAPLFCSGDSTASVCSPVFACLEGVELLEERWHLT